MTNSNNLDTPNKTYLTRADVEFMTDSEILEKARQIALSRLAQGPTLISSKQVVRYLQAIFATHNFEVFAVIYLNSQHTVIKYQEHFFGTLDGAAVYPREVAKAALLLDAGAVIFAHNHPSGHSEPSHADQAITRKLKDALAMFDIRTLDHIIVTPASCTSMADRGLM